MDRLPAWVTYSQPDPSVMGGAYNGVYWDPSDGEKFPGFQALRPKNDGKNGSLRIYEAHVGMSSTEPVMATYKSFAEEVSCNPTP